MCLVLALAGAAWALWVALSGGIGVRTSWLRLTSRDPLRPAIAAGVALLLFAALARRTWSRDVRWLLSPGGAAALLAVAALVIGLHWGSFVAGGADSSGYVSQADRWVRGTLTWTLPDWTLDATWEGAQWTGTPLGYRPTGDDGQVVPTYSIGLPLMMAGLQWLGGPDAAFLVVPLLGALAVFATYLLGRRMGGEWAGVIAAVLMLASPAFLLFLVQPMSDVPVAAWWVVALWAALGSGAWAAPVAGLATAAAVLTRPNLVPLGGIVALILLLKPHGRARDLVGFALPVVLAGVFIARMNAAWYGSALESGYGGLEDLYALERVWPNLLRYGGWWVDTQTPLAVLALAAPFVAAAPAERRVVALTAIVFPATVLALYVAYYEFEVWWYLRFLLPAFPPLFAATGAVLVSLAGRAPSPRAATAVVLALVAAVALAAGRYSEWLDVERREERFLRAAAFAREAPRESVFVSLVHSGSIRHYSGRDVLRWEWLGRGDLDEALAFLRARGHRVYLVADAGEVSDFRNRFAGSAALGALDDRPIDLGGVLVYEFY